jgi:preprotein translocase subunit SecG
MSFVLHIMPYIQVIVSVLLTIAILMQKSVAGLGLAFDNSGFSNFSTRRGMEKTLFNATIGLSIFFVLLAFLPLLITQS